MDKIIQMTNNFKKNKVDLKISFWKVSLFITRDSTSTDFSEGNRNVQNVSGSRMSVAELFIYCIEPSKSAIIRHWLRKMIPAKST